MLVVWCWLVALVLAFVLAPPAPLLLVLISRCQLVALVLAPPTPLLLLLAVWCWLVALVLVCVLAPLDPLLQCVFAQCQMIAPNSSLQDWHAFVLDYQIEAISICHG